jgi:hypothetical protein
MYMYFLQFLFKLITFQIKGEIIKFQIKGEIIKIDDF